MAASVTNLRNPVKRLHSLNRQKEYVTPTTRDVLCPYFDGTFVKTGVADVTHTYCALCLDDNAENACDYRESKLDLQLCKRYWADPTLDLTLTHRTPAVAPPMWQEGEVIFNYERTFKNRTADVILAITRLVPVQVNLGNFLRDWQEWGEGGKGDWQQTYSSSAGRDEILNKENQSGRSFWYNPAHMHFKNYVHEYHVQARGGDDDMYGSIFRYNGTSFYSFEWDSGGMSQQGMGLYRNVYNGKSWTKTRLAHRSIYWGSGSRYIHRIVASVINNRISISVYRKNGASEIKLASLEYFDTDPTAPVQGAWGPMTESQPDTYFWDLKVSNLELLNSSTTSKIKQQIPLEYELYDGSLHLVSKPLSTYFSNNLVEEVVKANNIEMSDVATIEYWLLDTNVYEGVQFSLYESMKNVTENLNARIAMTTFNYDAEVPSYNGYLYAPHRKQNYIVSDISNLDKHLTSIIFRPVFKRVFDWANIKVNGVTVRYLPGVGNGEHVVEFPVPYQLERGDVVSIEYYANDFEMEYYKGDYVDTHDKVFKIEGNKLHWHHVPSYEGERK